jgi:cardiolipin synthase
MLNIPNLLTLLRIVLVPVPAWLLLRHAYATALAVFLAAGMSDALDGFLARRWNQFTPLGAMLDPIADKLLTLTCVGLLAWQSLLPLWLALALIARDLVIVAGAAAYHRLAGGLEMAPTLLGKIHTSIIFGMFALVLANAAAVVATPDQMRPLFGLALLVTLASGLNYMWVWGRKAARLSGKNR